MSWIKYHPKSPNRPQSRKPVLLRFEEQGNLPVAIVVGYLKHFAGTVVRYWVTPGYDRGANKEPTHWQDCLGDNFYKELWEVKNGLGE